MMVKSGLMASRRLRRKVKTKKKSIFRFFCATVFKNLGEVLKYSELAGINHIIDHRNHMVERYNKCGINPFRHPLTYGIPFYSLRCRFIWLVVILLCCAGIGYTCAYQWNRYEANPTVISLERDYRHWNGTLPSVTMCYTIKIDPTRADDYVKRSPTIAHAIRDH